MSQYFANIGSVRNTGLEVAMDVDAIRTKDWKWNIGLNLTTIHNEITKLPGGKDILHGTQNYSEGHSIYEFYTYTYAGVDQMNGRALYNANSQLGESTINALKAQDEYVTINGKKLRVQYIICRKRMARQCTARCIWKYQYLFDMERPDTFRTLYIFIGRKSI